MQDSCLHTDRVSVLIDFFFAVVVIVMTVGMPFTVTMAAALPVL